MDDFGAIETNKKFCSKCKFYMNDTCQVIYEAFSETMINEIFGIKTNKEEIIKKYQCPYKLEIFMENLENSS